MRNSNFAPVSFEDTSTAFAYKSDRELQKAHWLFKAIDVPFLVKWGTALTPWAIRNKLPVKNIIRTTIFSQFVGGETLPQTAPVVEKLGQFDVDVILDYGVEGGEGSEHQYDLACEEFLKVIQFSAANPHIPFMSIKVTGLAASGLLEKLDRTHAHSNLTLFERFQEALETLTENEARQWDSVYNRVQKICTTAAELGVGVLIDAEESWMQDPVDALTIQMMRQHNKEKAVVFNTYQMYRHDRLAFLQYCLEDAIEKQYVLGAKLVRGAYMEKERERAQQWGYPSPIQPSKTATDAAYNAAITLCAEHVDSIEWMVASHNEESNLLAAQLIEDIHEDGAIAPNVYFSQLYGMSDHITFNLAKAGYTVSKYVPFGPIGDVIPYLMRRAQENSSVAGQTGRELSLLEKEVKRRKNNFSSI